MLLLLPRLPLPRRRPAQGLPGVLRSPLGPAGADRPQVGHPLSHRRRLRRPGNLHRPVLRPLPQHGPGAKRDPESNRRPEMKNALFAMILGLAVLATAAPSMGQGDSETHTATSYDLGK